MTHEEVAGIIADEVNKNANSNETEMQKVKSHLVDPQTVTVIDFDERETKMFLIAEQHIQKKNGYCIVYDGEDRQFGLAAHMILGELVLFEMHESLIAAFASMEETE